MGFQVTGPLAGSRRRIPTILLAIALCVALVKYVRVLNAESFVPAWRAPEVATVLILVPEDASLEERGRVAEMVGFESLADTAATLFSLRGFFEREFARYGSRPGFAPVVLKVLGPFDWSDRPPAPPRASENAGFFERFRRTRAFLGHYDRIRARYSPPAGSVVFLRFFRERDAPEYAGIHSVADRRSRSGFVFAPLTELGAHTAMIQVAHELLHLYGAKDKYEGERSRFPEGYVEPWRAPRFPQRFAEVMAQGIPLAEGAREGQLDLVEQMRIGVETAFEIGWIDRARRDRYYAGDAAAGPRMED